MRRFAYHYNSSINKSSGENEGEERSPGKRDIYTEIEGDGILDYSSEKKGKHIGKILCRVEKLGTSGYFALPLFIIETFLCCGLYYVCIL